MAAAGSRISPPVVAAAAWLLTVGLSVVGSALSAATGRPPELYLPLTVSGIVYATAGALIYLRRPDNAIGPALIAAAALPAALVDLRYLFPALVGANIAFSMQLALLPLAYIVLTFPSGQFANTADRAVFVGAAVLSLVAGVVEISTIEPPRLLPVANCQPCNPNPFRLFDYGVYPLISTVDNLVFAVIAAVIVFRVVRRWRSTHGLTHAALTPVVAGGAVLAVGYALVLILNPVNNLPASLVAPTLLALRLAVPIGLAVVFVSFQGARTSVMRELVRLGPRTDLASLETGLRRASGDSSLTVLRRSGSGYVGAGNERVAPDELGDGRHVLEVSRDGQPVAAVIYDPVLDADRELIAAIAETVRYGAESSEIHAELVARGGDVTRLPRGQVTFLFGDVERSTELLRLLGDRYGDLIAQLRSLIRGAADGNDGQVVDMRADECFLAFSAASDGLLASIAIQRVINATKWPDGSTVRLRIGLHTGRPDVTADGYVGLDVHHAARIMATARGGQIVASSSFAEAVGRAIPERIRLFSLGEFELRGLPGSETLFEVREESA